MNRVGEEEKSTETTKPKEEEEHTDAGKRAEHKCILCAIMVYNVSTPALRR